MKPFEYNRRALYGAGFMLGDRHVVPVLPGLLAMTIRFIGIPEVLKGYYKK